MRISKAAKRYLMKLRYRTPGERIKVDLQAFDELAQKELIEYRQGVGWVISDTGKEFLDNLR